MHSHLYTRERMEADRDHVSLPLLLRRKQQAKEAYYGATKFKGEASWLSKIMLWVLNKLF